MAGWEVQEAGEIVVEPGQEPPTPGTGSLDMTKDQISVALHLEPAGEEVPLIREPGWCSRSTNADDRGLGRPAVQPGRPLRADGAGCAGCEWGGHNSVAFTLTR